MEGTYSAYGERTGIYRFLVEKPRCRWEQNIKMDLQEFGCGSMVWIDLAQDRNKWWTLVNAVMNLRVP
jgi:hypothetical protein